MMRAFNQMK